MRNVQRETYPIREAMGEQNEQKLTQFVKAMREKDQENIEKMRKMFYGFAGIAND